MSCNDNQNHLVKPGRTTSRVLAPPGGKTSFSLGMDDDEEDVKRPVANKTIGTPKKEALVEDDKKVEESKNAEEDEKETAKENTEDSESAEETVNPTLPGERATPSKKEPPVSSNAFASGANMNGAQVMTGRPTSRVLAPPGGVTSWTL